MKSVKPLLLAILFLGSFAVAAHGEENWTPWTTTFYKTKNTRTFDAFWKSIITKKYLENHAAAPLTGFISQVISQYPDLITGRMDNLEKFSHGEKDAIITILWMSDTAQARAVLKKYIKDADLGSPPKITEIPMNSPVDLDFCWGFYFATGDTRALDKIITTLEYARYDGAMKKYSGGAQTEEDLAAATKEAMYLSSMWSLDSNAKADPIVARYLQTFMVNSLIPRLTASSLQRILQSLAEYQRAAGRLDVSGLHEKDTDNARIVDGFGAMVIATADKDWSQKWMETPAEQPFHVTQASALRVGEQVVLLLMYANPMPDKDGNIDISYDVKTTKPDNNVTEQKNLTGSKSSAKGKNLKNMFLAEHLTVFIGEESDTAGEWVFEYRVRDNIRGVVVPLKLKLMLTK